MLRDYLSPGPLVLDTSAVINILGCGQTRQVLEILGFPCLVEEKTRKEILRHPIPGQCHNVVLEELEKAGLVQFERMTSTEYEVYLSLVQGSLSTRLGDGESAAMALSSCRGHAVALDDNKARSIFQTRFKNGVYISSLKVFFTVAYRDAWSVERLRDVIGLATKNARMAIPRDERHLVEELEKGARES